MNIVEGSWAGLVEKEIAIFRCVLAELEASTLGAIEGVEIGSMDGFSTAHLLEATQRMHLTSIDPFIPDSMAPNLIGSEARFHANIAPWKERNTHYKDFSENVVRFFDKPLDFLFIDGDHTYPAVMRDYMQWTPFLKTGGILAMHDSRQFRIHDPGRGDFHPGPSQVAQDEVFNRPDRWEIVGEVWALTVAKKRG